MGTAVICCAVRFWGTLWTFAVVPSNVDQQPPAHEEAAPEGGCTPASTCREKCEEKREKAEADCRKIPVSKRARREACWRKANEDYAKCEGLQ